MVYTKHFVIHTFDKLNNACSYIENAEKTEVTNDNPSEHLEGSVAKFENQTRPL